MFLTKVLVSLVFVLLAQGASIKRSNGYIQLPFKHSYGDHKNVTRFSDKPYYEISRDGLNKRGTDPATLINEQSYYAVDITVGQSPVTVLLDTGSSDLWVVDSDAYCESNANCYSSGTYTLTSNAKDTGYGFSIGYGDGSGAEGEFYTDNVKVGSVTVKNQQFADASNAASDFGVLGIAKKAQEAAQQEYDNLPVNLVNQGYISKNAYSLYLNSVDAKDGAIIFGGIDHDKYSGNLVSLPITTDKYLAVHLNSILNDGSTTDTNADVDVVLDSGTTFVYLPTNVIQSIASAFNAQYSSASQIYVVDCNWTQSDKTLTYNFDGISITVPYANLVVELHYNDGTFSGQCGIGIVDAGNKGPFILGDNFLRSAYVVYDLTDNQISLAQVKYSDSSNVQSL
ncbi:unnamed protein product [Candida verbasci]|uniref:candidapepsin n=1 Tax=Candida verbasci TaxID=1227364 RepID=A0A9W4XN62_9ASCO|nr:unnamed protein product [Candida verbasci]